MVARGRGRWRFPSRPARTNPSRLRSRNAIGLALSASLSHGLVHSLAAAFEIGTSAAALLNRDQIVVGAMAAGLDMTATLSHVSPVTPGSQTFDSGSGSFETPAYNTLTVEGWAAGGGGSGKSAPSSEIAGTAGGNTTVSGSGIATMTATGGKPGSGTAGGAASGATGGNTENSSSTAGTAGGNTASNGIGGGSPHGGASKSAPTTATNSGFIGNAPGGGGTGCNYVGIRSPGASGGAYFKSIWNIGDPGAPVPGDMLAYSVGGGGSGGDGVTADGGPGAAGRVKFSWS